MKEIYDARDVCATYMISTYGVDYARHWVRTCVWTRDMCLTLGDRTCQKANTWWHRVRPYVSVSYTTCHQWRAVVYDTDTYVHICLPWQTYVSVSYTDVRHCWQVVYDTDTYGRTRCHMSRYQTRVVHCATCLYERNSCMRADWTACYNHT